MDSASIVILITGAVFAVMLTGLGIKQILKDSPTAFYMGEEPPAEGLLISVRKWNTGHGLLWILYALIVGICFACAVFLTDDALVRTLLLFCGAIFPAGLLAAGHILLKRLYLKGRRE